MTCDTSEFWENLTAAEANISSASYSNIGQQVIPNASTALSANGNCNFKSSGVSDPSLYEEKISFLKDGISLSKATAI